MVVYTYICIPVGYTHRDRKGLRNLRMTSLGYGEEDTPKTFTAHTRRVKIPSKPGKSGKSSCGAGGGDIYRNIEYLDPEP